MVSPVALGYPIFTEADTLEQLRDATRDAVQCHVEDGTPPGLVRLYYIRDDVFAVGA